MRLPVVICTAEHVDEMVPLDEKHLASFQTQRSYTATHGHVEKMRVSMPEPPPECRRIHCLTTWTTAQVANPARDLARGHEAGWTGGHG